VRTGAAAHKLSSAFAFVRVSSVFTRGQKSLAFVREISALIRVAQPRGLFSRGTPMHRLWLSLALIAVLFAVAPAAVSSLAGQGDPPVSADVVLVNGKIWTVNKAQPEAQALAIWRDRIVAVGSDNAVKPLVGP